MWPIGQTHKTTAASGLVGEWICKPMVLTNVAEPPAFLQTEKWKSIEASREFFVHKSQWKGPIAIFWCSGKTSCSVLNIGVCTNMTFTEWTVTHRHENFFQMILRPPEIADSTSPRYWIVHAWNSKATALGAKHGVAKGVGTFLNDEWVNLRFAGLLYTQYPTCDIVNLAETFGFNFPTIKQADRPSVTVFCCASRGRLGERKFSSTQLTRGWQGGKKKCSMLAFLSC